MCARPPLPELPVVISARDTAVTNTWRLDRGHAGHRAVAQENVGCNDSCTAAPLVCRHQALLDHLAESPDEAAHHFHNNARTFLNIGKAMGDEMILAINDMAYCNAQVWTATTPFSRICFHWQPRVE